MINQEMLIYRDQSIKEALKKLNTSAKKVLLVVDKKNTLLGTLTDGDIREYILKGKSLRNSIKAIYNQSPSFLKKSEYSIEAAKNIMVKNKIELLPVVDPKDKVIGFVTWDQLFTEEVVLDNPVEKLNVPLVIMAGGVGTRLEPFTSVLPKPLIPVGNKPIIEIIIDEFKAQGIDTVFLVINYRGEMIELYFSYTKKAYDIKYVKEKDFLGTAGGLRLLMDSIADTFIVSNCDIIVKASFNEVLALHRKHGAALTIVSSIRYYKIPYGIIKFKDEGEVTELVEKPEYSFTVNTGVYIVDKKVLSLIPPNKPCDMTDLIKVLFKKKLKVFTYPVYEGEYIDIGQWEEYKKAVDKLNTKEV